MPRVARKPESVRSPILDDLLESLSVIDRSIMQATGKTREELDAERARDTAKWQRREAKAVIKWRRMPLREQQAWADAYLRDLRRSKSDAKMPKPADLALLFAVTTVTARMTRKAEKAKPQRDLYAEHVAVGDTRTAAPRVRSAVPAPKAAPVVEEPRKPKKKRRGPAVGSVGYQIDGAFHYHEDDDDE